MKVLIDLDNVVDLLNNAERIHCAWFKKSQAVEILKENCVPLEEGKSSGEWVEK